MIPDKHILHTLFHQPRMPLIMGILNITTDSFSDGRHFLSFGKAMNRVKELLEQGADILDIGGESTRPGSGVVSAEEEIDRVIPVIQAIRQDTTAVISIDTRKAIVADAAIQAGADIVNDVSALQFDPLMPELLADYPEIGLILMHAQGTPETMQINPCYQDVMGEITEFFQDRIALCRQWGIGENRLMLDPGIGFGKNLQHNLTILSHMGQFHGLGLPLVLGASRKRFIDNIITSEPDKRIGGSLAATMMALEHSLDVIRVHDVWEHNQFIAVVNAIRQRD